MKRLLMTAGTLALICATAPYALAQDDDETMFTYATYMYCNTADEAAADADAARAVPILDQLVEDGAISNYGWLVHHTGGQWRRIRYHQAPTLSGVMNGLEALNEAMLEAFGDNDLVAAAASAACPRHDDYVWEVQNGAGGDERGKIGISVYHVCDMTREERADEIVDDYIAPILDGMVEDGKLTSWGWSSHVIGGHYRRLQTMTATDLETLLAARTEAIQTMYEDNSETGTEFSAICGQHSDYIWGIAHEGG